jgi:hypothetical protein
MIMASSAAGDGCDSSSGRYEPCDGHPSRHSAAQMIVPPGFTTRAAADMPFTA